MPQDDPRRLDAVGCSNTGCSRVSKRIRAPAWHLRSLAGALNREVVRASRVTIAWSTFRVLFPLAIPVAGRLRRLTVLGTLGLVPGPGFTWRKQIGVQVGLEPRPDDFLGVRAEVDYPLFAIMLGLMRVRSVFPDVALHLDVDGPDGARLAWAATGPKLEVDHRPDLRRDERLDG